MQPAVSSPLRRSHRVRLQHYRSDQYDDDVALCPIARQLQSGAPTLIERLSGMTLPPPRWPGRASTPTLQSGGGKSFRNLDHASRKFSTFQVGAMAEVTGLLPTWEPSLIRTWRCVQQEMPGASTAFSL